MDDRWRLPSFVSALKVAACRLPGWLGRHEDAGAAFVCATRDESRVEAAVVAEPDQHHVPARILFNASQHGFGPHLCLGAAHARLLARTLVNALAQRSAKIKVLEETKHVENQATYTRVNGYDSLTVSFK